jgi:hypothetical protein
MMVTWQVGDADSNNPIEWMEGRKYEKAAGSANESCGYRFLKIDVRADALIVITSRFVKSTIAELGLSSASHAFSDDLLRSNGDMLVSMVTLDYANMEIGYGGVTPEDLLESDAVCIALHCRQERPKSIRILTTNEPTGDTLCTSALMATPRMNTTLRLSSKTAAPGWRYHWETGACKRRCGTNAHFRLY